MKNKEIYIGIILLITIILAGQAIEPKQIKPEITQPQLEQYSEEQNDTTTNITDTPETNTTEAQETENTNPDAIPTLPNCTGSYGNLIKTSVTETYTLWDLGTPTDSVKIYATLDPTTAYQVYAAKKLSGPWANATEYAIIDTDNSTIAIYLLPGTYRYIKVANNCNRTNYEVFNIEKCIGGGNGTITQKSRFVDAVPSLGKGRGGCGCDPPRTTTTTSTTTTSTTTSTSTTSTSTTTTTITTTTSTTTTSSTTSTSTSTSSTTTTSTTSTSTTTTTIPDAPEFGATQTPLLILLIAPAFAYLATKKRKEEGC